MKDIQDALAPVGVPCFPGAWKPTDAQGDMPDTYIAYTVTRYEYAHADDVLNTYSVYVYLTLFTTGDPTELRVLVRNAMRADGYALYEERDDHDETSGRNMVAWTFRSYADPEPEYAGG